MPYEVRCECGKTHAVGAADAGASLCCGCGRTVEVPALHELRLAAGQFAFSPEVTLANLLARGELPDTLECIGCGEQTGGIVFATVACEQAAQKKTYFPAGCFSPILWVFGVIIFLREPRDENWYGRDVWFRVPVRYCPGCTETLTDAKLRVALRQHPVCAGVLDKYPQARVARAS